ncbi:mandelate racemase/muconate lactonizing enzyme family protein [Larkinella sp.]|uniref:mandelate racemase/muconate lactonizing enzyme family protein n=1 Tax=Larkinella sp. TaxID=2034517 RepID=UPI003BA8E71A
MKITDITTHRIRLSAEAWFHPRPIPPGHVPYWEFPLTTLHTDDGLEGYTMDYGPLGQGRASAHAVHDVYYHELVGKDPLNHEAIWQAMRSKQRHLYNLREAIWGNLDVALWDIKGKAAGMSIAKLLGQYRDKVPTYATCPPQTILTVDEVEQEVRLKIRQGFRGIKLQLSGGSALDIPRLRKAREVAGDGFPLMLDSSAVLTFEDALKIGYELDELRYEWFEEPFPDAHLVLLKKLSQAIRTPVLAAETVGLFELPHYMTEGAIDLIRADVHHKSGVTGLMKAMGMCEMMGYGLEIHTAGAPLLDVANLHVGCATKLSRFLESHHPMFRFGLKTDPLEIREDGCQHCPTGPGLGVDLDWDWLDNHTVDVIRGCGY